MLEETLNNLVICKWSIKYALSKKHTNVERLQLCNYLQRPQVQQFNQSMKFPFLVYGLLILSRLQIYKILNYGLKINFHKIKISVSHVSNKATINYIKDKPNSSINWLSIIQILSSHCCAYNVHTHILLLILKY